MDRQLIVAAIILFIVLSGAGASYGLVVGPARFEARLPSGETAGADYYVQNDETNPVHIKVEPENWHKDVYDYRDLDIRDWIEFDTYEFELKPKEIKKLRLRIKVPADFNGELVSQIFFTSSVHTEAGEPVEGLNVRLGAILFVAIKGTEVVDAEIKHINFTMVTVEEKERLNIEVIVKNKGNVHLNITGKVLVQDEKGRKIAELDLRPGHTNLPNKEDSYTATCEAASLVKGKYKAVSTINYGKEYEIEKIANFERTFEIGDNREVITK